MQSTFSSKLPYRTSLFWDCDATKLDAEKHKRYIISRILEHGRDDEVKWVWNFYDKNTIKEVFLKARDMSGPSVAYWNLILKIKKPPPRWRFKQAQNGSCLCTCCGHG